MSGRRNVTTQSLEQKLVQDLRKLQAEFQQFKNTQPVGADSVKAIILTASDGSKVGMGQIPATSEFGFFSLDPDGNLTMKAVNGIFYIYDPATHNLVSQIANGTIYSYDPTTGKNVMQLLKLPDGSYGLVTAKPGINVAEAY